MLKQRVLTALALAPIVLCCVFILPQKGFALFVAAVCLVAAWEWSALAGFATKLARLLYVLCFLPLLSSLWVLKDNYELLPWVLGVCALWLFACLSVMTFPKNRLWSPKLVRAALGLVFITMFWLSLVNLKFNDYADLLLLQLLLIIWSADIGAYFTGKRFGRRKLAPQVSPGKTWEGVMGGVIAVTVVSALFVPNLDLSLPLSIIFVLLCVVVGLFSVMGDLFESMLKRYVGIKDSGVIFPGHGGMLDRIDSLLIASPMFVAGLSILLGAA